MQDNLKVLLVLPPTAERPVYAEPPLGLLYVGTALNKAGFETSIIDIYRKYISPEEFTDMVRRGGYNVIGFGGITTCYGYIKEAAISIRKRIPSVHLIAGGVLSSAYEILLKNTPIDVICMGEGEITVVNIVKRLAEGRREFGDINGVSFLNGSKIIRTPQQEYIKNLDELPIPDYSMINMDIYAFDAMKDSFFAAEPSCRAFCKEGMRSFNLKTARGCTNSCTFCYRHFYGYRQHSVKYVIDHIRSLQERFNIHFFRFGDELFTRNKEWIIEFSRQLIESGIKIKYIVHGVRTDNVDAELMSALRSSGCVSVFVGFESGSGKILKVMKKNVTVEQNIKAIKTIRASGLNVLVQTVIGMPGEDDETIGETVSTLIKSGIDPEWVAINYAQAYPGTWLWRYAVDSGLISDPEAYLIGIGKSDTVIYNYTSCALSRITGWKWRIIRSLLLERAKRMINPLSALEALDPRLFSIGSTFRSRGIKAGFKKISDRLISAVKKEAIRE